jgi:hypothetical protein
MRKGSRPGRSWFTHTGVAGGDASPADRDTKPRTSPPTPDAPYTSYAPFDHDALHGLQDQQDDTTFEPYDFLPADPAPEPSQKPDSP